MNRTYWLASYPKSGNTWFRMLVANLTAKGDEPVDINDLPSRGGIASARGPLDYWTMIDSGLLTHDEIDRLRPLVYEALAAGLADDEYDEKPTEPVIRLVKAHDAYTLNAAGEPLLAGSRGAAGAIVLVRDPRDVVPSLASHNGHSIDKTIASMNSTRTVYCAKPGTQASQLRQILLDWSGHVASWLDQTDIPVHLVRYEDLRADPVGVFTRALAFAGLPATAEEIERAVRLASFDNLKQQERDKGFRENPRHGSGGFFFRRGVSGGWRDELTAEQVADIERHHGAMMRRLGYELATANAAAPDNNEDKS